MKKRRQLPPPYLLTDQGTWVAFQKEAAAAAKNRAVSAASLLTPTERTALEADLDAFLRQPDDAKAPPPPLTELPTHQATMDALARELQAYADQLNAEEARKRQLTNPTTARRKCGDQLPKAA